MEILARQTYNRLGKLVDSKTNYSSNGLMPHEMVAKLTDQSYRKMNKFPSSENNYKITFGPFVAITETVAALSLVWCFRSIATVLNLLMTFGEFGQAWVAGIDPNKKKAQSPQSTNNIENEALVRKEIENKESGMAWFQIFAGTGGVLGLCYEFLFGKRDNDTPKEVPLFKKITLSATSALNVFFMLGGAAEKSLMSMLSWNGGGKGGKGQDYRSMQINGAADVRGAIEWAFMTLVPWISNIDSLKHVVDIAVTYGAIREGADYFKDSGKMDLSFGGKDILKMNLKNKPILKKIIETFVNPFSLFARNENSISDERRYNLCWPFNKIKKWYVGTENDKQGPGMGGVRNKVVAPILKNLFACELPNIFLNKDNLICEYTKDTNNVLNNRIQNISRSYNENAKDPIQKQGVRNQSKLILQKVAVSGN